MKKTIFSLVAALALVGRPTPATATSVIRCMIESVAECDARFPPNDYRNISIRGWCYIIYTGICTAS
jgi:hypothetical protein